MKRRLRAGASALALGAALCAWTFAPAQTEAAWVDAEVVTGGFTAGEVKPATGLRCSGGLLQPVTFLWTPPASGLPRTGYRWTVTGSLSGSGTLPATATSITLNNLGLLTLGSGTFSLYTVGPGGWESKTPATGSLFAVSLLGIGLAASCSS